MSQYPMKWDLDVIFAGGSGSPEARKALDDCTREMEIVEERLLSARDKVLQLVLDDMADLILSIQDISTGLREVSAYSYCLEAQDTSDTGAVLLSGRVMSLSAKTDNLWLLVEVVLAGMGDGDFEALIARPELTGISFNLRERRRLLKEKMDPSIEYVLGDLIVDGYHAWGKLYDVISGQVRVRFKGAGGDSLLSLGQANNRLFDKSREIRSEAFRGITEAWEARSEETASILNSVAGYKVSLYKHRGWTDLKEAVTQNRIREKTIRAMWSAVDSARSQMVDVLGKKAALMGLDKLSWYDLQAPVGTDGGSVDFQEACGMVVENFARIGGEMADFAAMALSRGWVEAEDRPGKGQGAFCSSLPMSGQSRIFMTYGNSISNVSTLAHELGHGYHSHVLTELPYLARRYPMSLAETASLFSETLVSRALLAKAGNPGQRLALLGDRVNDAIAMFMDIRARFTFEENLLEARRGGPLGPQDFKDLMCDAQRKAFGDSLEEYFPLFWAAKLHFYDTPRPFYNFPYTFGYLFSTGLVRMAEDEGRAFGPKYRAFLRDSGNMSVEDLALTHLGEDITSGDFWLKAVSSVLEEVNLFLEA